MTEHHSSANYFSDVKELQVLCTSTLNCTHYYLLLLAKIAEGRITIRISPEYVSVITHKTSLCKHNFAHFLSELSKTETCFVVISFQLCSTICHLEDSRKPAWTEIEW
jgi:hypothetical protein